jgi:hypothetical protein
MLNVILLVLQFSHFCMSWGPIRHLQMEKIIDDQATKVTDLIFHVQTWLNLYLIRPFSKGMTVCLQLQSLQGAYGN